MVLQVGLGLCGLRREPVYCLPNSTGSNLLTCFLTESAGEEEYWKWIYPSLDPFERLCLAHKSWMLATTFDDPPFEKGIMWSKWRLSLEPHCWHRPLSLAKTSRITSPGISRLWTKSILPCWLGSESKFGRKRNFWTFRAPSNFSKVSTRSYRPMSTQTPFLIFR